MTTEIALPVRIGRVDQSKVMNSGGNLVASAVGDAEALQIVLALNSHQALLAACERALETFDGCDCTHDTVDEDYNTVAGYKCLPCQLRAAIKLATDKEI